MTYNLNESFTNKCYIYNDEPEDCITIPEYGNKCISKDRILKHTFSNDRITLNNIKNKLIQDNENQELKKTQDYEEEKKNNKEKCKNIMNLNKECNEECKKGNKYLCNKYLSNSNSNNYIVNEMIDCSKYELDGYMIKSCKPYNKHETETVCLDNIYFNKKLFNTNNLMISGEKECNKKGMGIKNFKTCPYDDTKVLFECDKNYLNGEPMENNRLLEFKNKY